MADIDVARLLAEWNEGDPDALGKLMPLVFEDLRGIARRYFAGESPSHTLQPTALVNELYLRLHDRRKVRWESPAHFFRTAAGMIRRLLVDHARRRKAERRGGGTPKIPLDDDFPLPLRLGLEDLLSLDEALGRLQTLEPRQCEVVELKYFAGLTIEEIVEVLGVQPTTVKKDWRIAKAWLRHELGHEPDP